MGDRQVLTHAALDTLEYENDVLLWGGRKVTDIAEELGCTPFYAYDREHMKQRVAELRKALPSDLQIHYAMKANPMPDVVRYMAELVDGLDVASAGELRVALDTDTEPADISFAGPGKQDSELKMAVEAGITINLESTGEMQRLARLAASLATRPQVAVRVNPSFELKSAGMKMGGRPSPFGVDAEKVPAMLEAIQALDLEFRGFHVFAGSQNLRTQAIVESLQQTVDLVIKLAATSKFRTSFVNLGGGLGIPYFPNEQALELDDLREPLQSAVDRLKAEMGQPDVIMELGRYLVGEAGIYVCRVIDVKESRGTLFAVCDGGLHHHLAASGNFGQIIRKNYPIAGGSRKVETAVTTVVGPLCTPLDLLADRVTLPAPKPGDLIAVLQSGAYGRSASPSRFLSHPNCREIFL
jgi:diaminopimelate decarboxylase